MKNVTLHNTDAITIIMFRDLHPYLQSNVLLAKHHVAPSNGQVMAKFNIIFYSSEDHRFESRVGLSDFYH